MLGLLLLTMIICVLVSIFILYMSGVLPLDRTKNPPAYERTLKNLERKKKNDINQRQAYILDRIEDAIKAGKFNIEINNWEKGYLESEIKEKLIKRGFKIIETPRMMQETSNSLEILKVREKNAEIYRGERKGKIKKEPIPVYKKVQRGVNTVISWDEKKTPETVLSKILNKFKKGK